jgi:hypothetical protein
MISRRNFLAALAMMPVIGAGGMWGMIKAQMRDTRRDTIPVHLPPGTYRFTEPLIIPDDVRVISASIPVPDELLADYTTTDIQALIDAEFRKHLDAKMVEWNKEMLHGRGAIRNPVGILRVR